MKIAAAILLVACLAQVSLFVGVSDISPLALFGQGGDSQAAQIMLASRGKPVLVLRRLSIGGLELGDDLGPGGYRELDEEDLCTLFKS